jgi:hypothetical protein
MSNIKCGSCGHENDHTRVFCQNCGTRLERTAPAPSGPTTTPVPVKRAAKRPGGMTVFGALGQLLRGLISLALLGAVIALFIQFSREPEGVPAAVAANDAAASEIFAGIKAFSSGPYQRSLDVKQEQINNYLAARVATAGGDTPAHAARFERAFVVLGDQSFRLFVERKYLGISFFFWIDCQPLAGPEGATALVKSGGIGRMPLPAFLAGLVQSRVIEPVVAALAEPLEILRRANQVDVRPDSVRLGWAAAKR